MSAADNATSTLLHNIGAICWDRARLVPSQLHHDDSATSSTDYPFCNLFAYRHSVPYDVAAFRPIGVEYTTDGGETRDVRGTHILPPGYTPRASSSRWV
jgi:hypothetical protein